MLFKRMGLRLLGVSGSLTGRTFDLAAELTFGREPGCMVSIPNDSGVSRRHARIVWLQGLPMVEDLGSRNGTLLNGARIIQARPIASGDEIRIGAEVFHVEAVLDGGSAIPPLAKETSRSEQRGQRHQERSGPEGSLYGQSASSGWDRLHGCALPNIDLSGCGRVLIIALLVLAAAAILALILFGVGVLVTSVGGAASSAVSGSGSPPTTRSPDSGATPLPPASTPPANPPQDQPPPQNPPSAEGIQIVDVKVDLAKRGSEIAQPVVLIKWLNLTRSPVVRLKGTVLLYDNQGREIAKIEREILYQGPAVEPGGEHQDALAQGGVIILKKLAAAPASAKVVVERIE